MVHGSPKQARNYSPILILPRITERMLQQSDTPSHAPPSQQDSYQAPADPAQVGCWHLAPRAKERADFLLTLPSIQPETNSCLPRAL